MHDDPDPGPPPHPLEWLSSPWLTVALAGVILVVVVYLIFHGA